MSDFPRGWSTSTQASGGGIASITIAAVPGVVHVLDAFTAKAVATAGGTTFTQDVLLTSSDGVFNINLALLQVPAASTADEASGSGLDLAAGPGASLTIAYSGAAPAGDFQFLVVQGHDI